MKFLNYEEWVTEFEKWSGLKITHVKDASANVKRLRVCTSTNVVLGELTLLNNRTDGWIFGGCSSLFPNDWQTLCFAKFAV